MINRIIDGMPHIIEIEHEIGVVSDYLIVNAGDHFVEFDVTGSVDATYDTGDYYTPSYYEIEKVEIEIDNVLLFNSEGQEIDLNDNDLLNLKKALDDCIIIT